MQQSLIFEKMAPAMFCFLFNKWITKLLGLLLTLCTGIFSRLKIQEIVVGDDFSVYWLIYLTTNILLYNVGRY